MPSISGTVHGSDHKSQEFVDLAAQLKTVRFEHVARLFAEQVTTNAYVDLDTAWDKRGLLRTILEVANSGLAGVHYQILGSLDGVNYSVVVVAQQLLAMGIRGVHLVSDYYPYLKIQVKSAAADVPTTVSAQGAAMGG